MTRMKNDREVRTYIATLEQRNVEGDDRKKLHGHAALFNRSADMGRFDEQIAPGTFSESITVDDVRALWNHNSDYVLGRTKAGTLRVWEDEDGLAFEIDPPNTQWARDLQISIDRGDVSQMSFGFYVLEQEWQERDGERDLRTIKKVQLWEVSPVTFPAYANTDVALRSKPNNEKQPRKLNNAMRHNSKLRSIK
jgi:HK97 family phage prohead protease